MEPHWVEELFPPKYSLLKTDLDPPNDETDKDIEDYNKALDQVKQRISPLDVSAIKNVYERVHLMTLVEEEERKIREDSGCNQGKSTNVTLDKSSVQILTATQAFIQSKTGHIPDESINVQDSCIWNEGEIEVLREMFKHTKKQNAKLRAVLDVTTERLKEMEEKYSDLNTVLTKRTKDLRDAQKANKRLQILCGNSQKETNKHQIENKEYRNNVKVLENQHEDLIKEIHELHIQLDVERIDRQKLELEMENLTIKNQQEQNIKEENMKLIHQEDVDYLRSKITELVNELSKEKEDHLKCRKGLDHLRTHFSALPLFNTDPGSNVVSKDQITHIDWKPQT